MVVDSKQYARQHAILDRLVFDHNVRHRTLADLRDYFRTDGPATERLTGRYFETFRVSDEARSHVTSDDALAPSMLSATWGLGQFALDVLETNAAELNQRLQPSPPSRSTK